LCILNKKTKSLISLIINKKTKIKRENKNIFELHNSKNKSKAKTVWRLEVRSLIQKTTPNF